MWSQGLFITSSDPRGVCRGDGSAGGPREDCALPGAASTLQNITLCPAQPLQGNSASPEGWSSPQTCEVVPKLTWHHWPGNNTRAVLCLKKYQQIYPEINSNS